ncbi:MAG: preprotein translocase subunit YajC [Planctomycetes bacterium]|nr:preprotein translocase subunit YajC [Planctomycetota bacterium]
MEFLSLARVLAEGDAKQAAPDGGLFAFAPFILIGIVFYFLLWRPQRREQAKRDEMLSKLQKNDRVVTIGGIIGVVSNISPDEKEVTLKVDDNTRMKFIRSSIQQVLKDEVEAEKPAEKK